MPGLNGIETSKKIRQELELSIPIIMMTAFGREEERQDAEKARVDDAAGDTLNKIAWEMLPPSSEADDC